MHEISFSTRFSRESPQEGGRYLTAPFFFFFSFLFGDEAEGGAVDAMAFVWWRIIESFPAKNVPQMPIAGVAQNLNAPPILVGFFTDSRRTAVIEPRPATPAIKLHDRRVEQRAATGT